jgi:hypothetical protein
VVCGLLCVVCGHTSCHVISCHVSGLVGGSKVVPVLECVKKLKVPGRELFCKKHSDEEKEEHNNR